MPIVVFYREADGEVPLLKWFESLPQSARVKCIAKLELLAHHGHLLRRPHADYLRDGIYELRTKLLGVNYRLLYFFHGRQAVVVTHGILKQSAAVPQLEIDRALLRKRRFEDDPAGHSHQE